MGYCNYHGSKQIPERNNLPWEAGTLYLAPAEHLDLRYLFAFTKIVLVLEIFSLLLITLLPLYLGGADKGQNLFRCEHYSQPSTFNSCDHR